MAHEHLLKRMNLKSETYSAALALLITVQAKTGPGSGYNLGSHSTGLPALCAYVASQELRNNDLSEKVAQQASCLKPKDFAKTLGIVRTVLSAGKSDLIIPESPTKRRRVDSPTKENTRSSPRKSTIPPTLHLARRSTPELDRSLPHSLPQSEEDESELEPLRRRFRPVFLDHTQWHARDPRLDKVWKNAEAHSEAMVKLYGHPFERYRPRDTDTRE